MKYKLNDLKITVQGDPKIFNCSHELGQGFIVEGENFRLLKGTKYFSHYSFASVMPFIAAKQRAKDNNDWMKYENDIACPDPKCGAFLRIERIGERVYEYGDD